MPGSGIAGLGTPRAIGTHAIGVQTQRMVGNDEALGSGHIVLAALDFGVVELLNLAAIQTDQMVVMLAFVELVHRLAGFKMTAAEDARLFELRQHPVHGRQTDIRAIFQQHTKHVFRRHVPQRALLKDLQYLQPRHRGFQSGALEFVDVVHGVQFAPDRRAPCADPAATMVDHIACPSQMPARRLIPARPILPLLAAALAAGWLTGCNTGPTISSLVSPYRATVVQGNFVSREQVTALKAGMSRQQVRDVLGTSLLTSVFHENRWDYVFTMRIGSSTMKEYKLTVFFQGDKLERTEGDEMPTETEFIAQIDTGKKSGKVPVLQATEEQLNKAARPNPATDAAANDVNAPADAQPRTSYPPLESPAR